MTVCFQRRFMIFRRISFFGRIRNNPYKAPVYAQTLYSAVRPLDGDETL